MSNQQASESLVASLLRPRNLALAVGLVIAGVGIRLGWNALKNKLASAPEYRLSVDTLMIQPESPPPWVPADVKQQVFRDTGLTDSLSLLDEPGEIQRRIVDAFELHPWVRKVTRVDLVGPGRVDVQLEYREPIAVIQLGTTIDRELLPVDADAVRLPEEDLTAAEKAYLPRITGITERPLVGAAWSDRRMLGAVELATKLRTVWESCSLLEIVPSPYPEVVRSHRFYVYDFLTSGGTTIRWGAAPGASPPTESTFAEKLDRLTNYVRRHGRLDTIDSPQVIDVRSTLKVEERIARQPAEEDAEMVR